MKALGFLSMIRTEKLFQTSQGASIKTLSVCSHSYSVTQGKIELFYFVKNIHTAFPDCSVKSSF